MATQLARLVLVVYLITASFHLVTPFRAQSVRSTNGAAKGIARSSPEWVRQGIIYEVFERAFSDSGTFNAITARLDDLNNLGVTILWLMPIHPIGKDRKKGSIGSPYAVQDYYAVNPDYGTAEDLRRLVREAHRRRMRVIIDIVANHTSWDSVLMKMPDFYRRDAGGRVLPPVADWAGPDVDVAQLDYGNPHLRDYMIKMMKYWLREFDLDGFRCDVAEMVPLDFWERARVELETIKPDILMLAEGNNPGFLLHAFDLDYDWPLFHKIEDVIIGREAASGVRATWEEECARFPAGALHMRFSDDHDEQRAIAQLGRNGALAASAFMLTIDGVPLLYSGMEVGDATESGAPALFERLPVFWGIALRRPEFPAFYKEMIALRRQHVALQQGETKWLDNSDESRIVSYTRKGGGEEFLVTINFSNRPFSGSVEGMGASRFKEMTPNLVSRPANAPKSATSVLPKLNLDAWAFRVFRRPLK